MASGPETLPPEHSQGKCHFDRPWPKYQGSLSNPSRQDTQAPGMGHLNELTFPAWEEDNRYDACINAQWQPDGLTQAAGTL